MSQFQGATGVVTPSGAQMTRSAISNPGTASFYEFTIAAPTSPPSPTIDPFIQYMFGNSLHSIGGSGLQFFTLPVGLTSGTVDMKVSTLDQAGNLLSTLYDGQATQSVTGTVSSLAYGIRIDFAQGGATDAVLSMGSVGSFSVAVPEPTSCLMFGTLMGLGFIRRRSA
jgi:hypothetical protein